MLSHSETIADIKFESFSKSEKPALNQQLFQKGSTFILCIKILLKYNESVCHSVYGCSTF